MIKNVKEEMLESMTPSAVDRQKIRQYQALQRLRLQAFNHLLKEEQRTVRLFGQIREAIRASTPEAIRAIAPLELELTGDDAACRIVGRQLGMAEYQDSPAPTNGEPRG